MNKNIAKTVSILFLALAITPANANNVATSIKNKVDVETSSFLGININKSTQADVIKKYGKTNIQSDGQGRYGWDLICYDTKCGQLIQFTSEEMDGDTVSGINVMGTDQGANRELKYAKTNINCEQVKTKSGLCIGMTKEWVMGNFGKADKVTNTAKNSEKWQYDYIKHLYVLPGNEKKTKLYDRSFSAMLFKKYYNDLNYDKNLPKMMDEQGFVYKYTVWNYIEIRFQNNKDIYFRLFRTKHS